MAYQYGDYEEQATDTLRLERLRLHISEISQDAGGARISSGGSKSRDPEAITSYLKFLTERRQELEAAVGGSSKSGGMIYADFR